MENPFSDYARRCTAWIGTIADRPGTAGIDDQFNRFAIELFRLQAGSVPPLSALCRQRDIDPARVANWRQIPALPAGAFKDFHVTSLAPSERIAWFLSSGTTASTSSRQFHDAESLALYEASAVAGFRRVIGTEPVRMIFLTPSGAQAPHSSLAHMFQVFADRLAEQSHFTGEVDAAGAWQVDIPGTVRLLDQWSHGDRRVIVFGTAFSWVHLLDGTSRSWRLPEGSFLFETGGYKGRSRSLPREQLHELMGRRFGAKILCEYGMSELGSQAYALDEPPRFQFPPWAHATILSPETGDESPEGGSGLICVTDLANVRSVISVLTGDLGRQCGHQFEWMGRARLAPERGCSLMSP